MPQEAPDTSRSPQFDNSVSVRSRHQPKAKLSGALPTVSYSIHHLIIVLYDILSLLHTDKYYAMKVLKKVEVVRLKQVEHINSEKQILAQVHFPFIVDLFCTYQDDRNLFMLLEYVIGGELFSHLRKAGRFTNDITRFYASEIVLAIEYLHSKDIIYRDLKPENLLLDSRGHIKITDFGFAKKVDD
ncbi:camp-dependent protein kinase catalytic subunit, partial [Jimgerdemannia flammicorona]